MHAQMLGRPARSRAWLVLVLGALVLPAAAARPVRAEEDPNAKLEAAYREGVDCYLQGHMAECKQRLDALVAAQVKREVLAKWVEEASPRVLARMMAEPRLGDAPFRLFEAYRSAVFGRLTDKDRLAKLAAALVDRNTSEDARLKFAAEAEQSGSHIVPFLARYLDGTQNADVRTLASLALASVGPAAVPPLVELLDHKDAAVRESVILTLDAMNIRDSRPVAALKFRSEDAQELPSVKAAAQKLLANMTGRSGAQAKSAAELYYAEARRYYLQEVGVAEEAATSQGQVWRLDDSGALAAATLPMWAWSSRVAEKLAWRGLKAQPDYAPLYGLLASVWAQRCQQVKQRLDQAADPSAKAVLSDEEKQSLQDWEKKAAEWRAGIPVCGKYHLSAALTQVLADLGKHGPQVGLADVGVLLCQALGETDPQGELLAGPGGPSSAAAAAKGEAETAKPEAGEAKAPAEKAVPEAGQPAEPVFRSTALAEALDSTARPLSCQAALTLAAMNRFPDPWLGQDKVAGVLARGMSEDRATQVLIVDSDQNARNETKQRLVAVGCQVSESSDGADGLTQAQGLPPKDLVLISDKLKGAMTAEQLLAALKADSRMQALPAAILCDLAARTDVQARFGAETALVDRDARDKVLRDVIARLAPPLQAESPARRRARETAVACATALASLDPRSTRIALVEAVPACLDALVNRTDEVRIPAVVTLGHVKGGGEPDRVFEKLMAAFQEKSNSLKLRLAALDSMSRIKAGAMTGLCVKLQTDESVEIQEMAAGILGTQPPADPQLLEILQSRRK